MAAKKRSTRKKVTRKASKPAARKKAAKKKVTKKKVAKKRVTKKKVAKKKAKTKNRATSKKRTAKKVKTSATAKKKQAKAKKKIKKKAAKKAPKKANKKVAKKAKKKASPLKKKSKNVARKVAKKPAKVLARRRIRRRRVDADSLIHGIEPYLARANEGYMSPEQLEHFKEILAAWKTELMEEADRTVHHMQDEATNFPDPNDRATQESEFGLELRTRDRERKLLKKIDSAVGRIDDGSYGFCEETGEAIGLERLEARPVATLSVEAQERRELAERQYRDRDDQYR